ncbi:hypothetical protein C3L33_18477, partial [Rhododendron williamsianum]
VYNLFDSTTYLIVITFLIGWTYDTSDEEVRKFFKHSSVKVLLCPRSSCRNGHSWVKQQLSTRIFYICSIGFYNQEAGKIYTHHQKTVIVDADAGHYQRKIIAFLGALTYAREDTTLPIIPSFELCKLCTKMTTIIRISR